jgi:hypothetical protein
MYDVNALATVTAPFNNATDNVISMTSSTAPTRPKPPNAKPRPAWSVLRKSCLVTRSAGNNPLTVLTSSVKTITNAMTRGVGSSVTQNGHPSPSNEPLM